MVTVPDLLGSGGCLCQHEDEQATFHFGHHSYQANADTADDGDLSAKDDGDCGYCHLSCQAPFLMASPDIAMPNGATAYIELLLRSFSSHIPDGLQRPNWRLVA